MSATLRDSPPVTMCTSPPGRYQYQTGTTSGPRPSSVIASIATWVSARKASRSVRVIGYWAMSTSRSRAGRETVHRPHVVAHELPARRGRQELHELGQLGQVARRVVGVREVRRPEELVLADARDDAGERALVRVARDPALALEVEARLLAEARVAAERRRVHRVHPLEPVADPPGARLEHDDLQARELLEHAELEHRREGVTDAVRRGHVDEERERRVGHPPEAPGRRPERLEARVDRDREADVGSDLEHAVVIRMPRRLPRHHEGRDEDTLHPVARCPLDLARGLV